MVQTKYAIASIAALKALNSSQRTDGYARLVKLDADGKPSWYTFIASSTATGDDDTIIKPSDNPSSGRWIKSSGAGGGESFGGIITCTSGCAVGGKAFTFYAPHTSLSLEIEVGFDITIASGTDSIQLHRWNQLPNTGLTGRQFVAELPHTGGSANAIIDSTHRWISIFARNPSLDFDAFDGVCFTVSGNTITLIGFS
ncbi:hypothetical protein [Aulosira sp. FACHB-615]|uniref:hypothetical protein n=1 Tax=Aulosira sp. FACHB-615 TaxID=2692777 RepID=UPI0016844AC0|nr:hypothetical protein [Aulosira sp. FACHB-615]MBD2489002.1 hypothetical protein [Aulosira sp. FACHB-615]